MPHSRLLAIDGDRRLEQEQGRCGPCWAFAATEAIESQMQQPIGQWVKDEDGPGMRWFSYSEGGGWR